MRKLVLSIIVLSAVLAVVLLLTTIAAAKPLSQQQPTVDSVEPDTLVSEKGDTLSIYGSGFTTTAVARLVGYGLLDTTRLNNKALEAAVPPGVPPGTYDLQVQVGETAVSTTLSSAVTVVAATATPGPTVIPTPKPTTVPGQPNLTILNYSIEPSRVVAGREFVVTIEIYNNGSRAGENTLVTFPGGTFVPVGEAGHQLWQLHINHTAVVTQRMRVPSGLSSGTYEVQVALSANDWGGDHFEFPASIPVEVAGVSGQPKLVVEKAETEPAVLGPGDAFSLTLRLANRGSRSATQATIGVASSELAVPADGSNVTALDPVYVGQCVTATLPLVLGDVEQAGRRNLALALEYGDYSGGSYADQQSVGLEVSTSLEDRPQLIVEGYETMPDSPAPGDTFTLTLQLTNVGGGEAKRLIVTLGGEGEASALGPFAPLRTSNVKFIPRLAAGAATDVVQRLAVDGSAEPGSYSLPVALAFDDARGTRHTDSQLISLRVRQQPHLQVRFYRPVPTTTVGTPFPLPVEVTNIGRTLVNVSTLELTSEDLAVQEGSLYVGPLDGGTSASLEATGVAQEGGAAKVMVNVHYLDDFEQPQVVTETLTVEVEEPVAPTPVAEPGGESPHQEKNDGILKAIGRVLRGLLGLGS